MPHLWWLSFRNCLSCVCNCDDHSLVHSFFRSSNIWIFIYSLSSCLLNGYIMNSHYDQLPVGLIAQLVEHCTGIAEVKGSNLVQAWIFSGFLFAAVLVAFITAMLILSFAVQIHEFSYVHFHFLFYGIRGGSAVSFFLFFYSDVASRIFVSILLFILRCLWRIPDISIEK